MGNRISDIGRMKSSVDIGNRMNMSDTKKIAKLGTEKNPAIVKGAIQRPIRGSVIHIQNAWLELSHGIGTAKTRGR
jgi:hypothetical protein